MATNRTMQFFHSKPFSSLSSFSTIDLSWIWRSESRTRLNKRRFLLWPRIICSGALRLNPNRISRKITWYSIITFLRSITRYSISFVTVSLQLQTHTQTLFFFYYYISALCARSWRRNRTFVYFSLFGESCVLWKHG